MSRWSFKVAVLYGTATLMILHALWFVVYRGDIFGESVRILGYFAPTIACFVTSLLSSRFKLGAGMLVAAIGPATSILFIEIYEAFGFHVDSIGDLSSTLMIYLAYYLIFGFIGSLAAVGIVRWSERTR